MDSALRPRDIQARIRAGESVDDVARAAGVSVDRIDAFAAPVIAEREHIAGLALTHPVRRRGETSSNRGLRQTVADSLTPRGLDDDEVQWDAWKIEGRRWQVQGRLASGSAVREALFIYDLNGRFTVAGNDDARWMIGDEIAAMPGSPVGSDDELALVRAIQSAPSAEESSAESPDEPSVQRLAPPYVPSATDVDDAFAEGELAEVDGIYDIVPGRRSDMDVLYDMLASFDEDSVKIYSGLVHPDGEVPGPVVLDAEPDEDVTAPIPALDPAGGSGAPTVPDERAPDERAPAEQAWTDEAGAEVDEVGSPESAPTPEVAPAADPSLPPSAESPAALETEPAASPMHDEPRHSDEGEDIDIDPAVDPAAPPPASAQDPNPGPGDADPDVEQTVTVTSRRRARQPEQPSLVDDATGPVPQPKPRRNRRASVPSWDEIMFGSPRKNE